MGQVTSGGMDDPARSRREMVATIDAEIESLGGSLGMARLDPDVRDAMLRVPRDRFVPAAEKGRAHANRPCPIGHGQTISQPLMVAVMTHHLAPPRDGRVLDVGTGSGYQAAVLALLAREVVTVEIVEPLATAARARLAELGYRNVVHRTGDARDAALDLAPFDRILVAAAADEIPAALVDQLAPGGRMIIPVGGRRDVQNLVLLQKGEDGSVDHRILFPVSFVPLTGHP